MCSSLQDSLIGPMRYTWCTICSRHVDGIHTVTVCGVSLTCSAVPRVSGCTQVRGWLIRLAGIQCHTGSVGKQPRTCYN
jgi:hypothetical protein